MFNYLKAELYRNINRPYIWVYSLILAGLALALNLIIKLSGVMTMSLGGSYSFILKFFGLAIYIVIAAVEITTGEEQKNGTLKNTITFGVPRSIVGLSKVIVAISLSFIMAIIVFGTYFGSSAILFKANPGDGAIVIDIFTRLLAVLPLWFGVIAVGTFLMLLINNSTTATFAYVGIFAMFSQVILLLIMFVSDKFNYVKDILITTQIDNLTADVINNSILFKSAGIGAIYTVLFTIACMVYIRKKEIK